MQQVFREGKNEELKQKGRKEEKEEEWGMKEIRKEDSGKEKQREERRILNFFFFYAQLIQNS